MARGRAPQQLARYIPAGTDSGLAWAPLPPRPTPSPTPHPATTCGEPPLHQGHAVAATQQLQVQARQRGALAGELRGHRAWSTGSGLRLPAGRQVARAYGARGGLSASAKSDLARPHDPCNPGPRPALLPQALCTGRSLASVLWDSPMPARDPALTSASRRDSSRAAASITDVTHPLPHTHLEAST